MREVEFAREHRVWHKTQHADDGVFRAISIRMLFAEALRVHLFTPVGARFASFADAVTAAVLRKLAKSGALATRATLDGALGTDIVVVADEVVQQDGSRAVLARGRLVATFAFMLAQIVTGCAERAGPITRRAVGAVHDEVLDHPRHKRIRRHLLRQLDHGCPAHWARRVLVAPFLKAWCAHHVSANFEVQHRFRWHLQATGAHQLVGDGPTKHVDVVRLGPWL